MPIVDCITPAGAGENVWHVHYGYVNSGPQAYIDFGDQNQVVPGLGFQGQPTVFNPGSYPRVFRAVFNANAFPGIEWALGTTSASATLASPRCQAGATGPASDLSPTGATLHGLVEPDGAQTVYSFNYGTTIAYGASTTQRTSSSASGVLASEPITGLQPNTTYHYRLVASSGTITTVGENRTFTTPPVPAVPGVPQPAQDPQPQQPENPPVLVAQSTPVFVSGATTAVAVPTADLALRRSGPRSRVRTGATLTIRLQTTNRGPATATKAGVVYRLGDGLRFVSARGPAGRCWGATTVRCPLGTLAAGRAGTVTVRVRATRTGRLTDTATVAAEQPEGRVADNLVTGTIRAVRRTRGR